MAPEEFKRGGQYFAVMSKGKQPIQEGCFGFIDGKDLLGVEDLAVYRIEGLKRLHNNEMFIFMCINPRGQYSADRRFIEQYVFDSIAEAKAKIDNVLREKSEAV